MISDTTLDAIQQAVTTKVITVDGVEFTTRPVHRVPLEWEKKFQKEPQPASLTLHSLTALVSYVQSIGEAGTDSHFVHVESPTQVSVLGKLYGEAKQRDCLAIAQFEHKNFPFGSYMNNEEFIVFLLARFDISPDQVNVLKVVGNIKEEKITQREDDGVTQTVVGRAGIQRAVELNVPNPVRLAPYRTFPEIEQPVSAFVLRMKEGHPLPQCALFEGDGGEWVNTAREAIKAFLQGQLPETTILA